MNVYGLACDQFRADAPSRESWVKGREAKGAAVDCRRYGAKSRRIRAADAIGARLAERFWPGPLTLILARAGSVAREVTGDRGRVRRPRPGRRRGARDRGDCEVDYRDEREYQRRTIDARSGRSGAKARDRIDYPDRTPDGREAARHQKIVDVRSTSRGCPGGGDAWKQIHIWLNV